MQRTKRVAVSADDTNGLDSVVGSHFGRCPYYVLVDLEGRQVKQFDVVANPYYGHHRPGQVPGFIRSQGADVMLTGGMGRRAINFFQQYSIETVTGASGTVRHALEQYLDGQLQGAEPCRESLEHGHDEAFAEGAYEQSEVGRLHEEAAMLQQQLEEVMKRLDSLAA
jgi:predicted Fe-Mo cluster-binding NifX family protein